MKTEVIVGYRPLLEAVHDKLCDGFYVPRENLAFLPPSIETDQLVRFRMPQGELLLTPKSFRKYGYDSAEDLADDCRRGLLQCRSLAGVLTLGSLRNLQGPGEAVVLSGTGLPTAPTFVADSPEQHAALVRSLKRLYPSAVILSPTSLRTGNLSRFTCVMRMACVTHLLFRAAPPLRRGFRRLLLCCFLAFLCLLLHLFGKTGVWIDFIAMMGALAGFTFFLRDLRRSGGPCPLP